MIKLKNGSYLKKKRYNRRSYFKAPLKMYTNMPNDFNRVKCELVDTIGVYTVNSDQFYFQNTGVAYLPIGVVLGASESFNSQVTEYARFKITGVSVTAVMANSPEHTRAVFLNGSPGACVAFYPQNTTQSMARSPATKDNNMVIYPNVTAKQTKYWSIPDNYMDNGAGGLGTWISSNILTTGITGQLAICNLEVGNTASSAINVYLLRVCVYVTFSSKID